MFSGVFVVVLLFLKSMLKRVLFFSPSFFRFFRGVLGVFLMCF